ncbi:protease modulator HflC [Cytobacillus sp. IB215665]|uniref:protease modulator HflC n=1 Tax=Cytobacillus sp. IB215665 TaxID=3097357 RepID=UPI002A0D3805|nr:protease modulator HflC [Cytobacillus sp. IB215665]MDX8363961.1 protease modulator HflC [Cytobacillus sp. IB215665]
MSDQNIVDINEQRKGNLDWKKYRTSGIFLIILLVLVGIILSNLFIVKEGEYKVIRQFGEVVDYKDEPGLSYKIPFIQTVTTLPKYQMIYDVEEAEINTRDKKRLIIDNYSVWKIDNPKLMIANARTVAGAEAKMGEFIYSVVRAELGKLDYDEVINDEKSSRGSLNDVVTAKVNELLARDNYGIQVIDVRMKRTDLPVENEQTVFTRMISDREKIAQEYLSRGDADKNRIIANTDKVVKEILSKAKADAEVIRGEGEAEAAKIYNESFSKDAEFYQLFRTLESYKTTINGETMIILPSDSPYANLLMGNLQ